MEGPDPLPAPPTLQPHPWRLGDSPPPPPEACSHPLLLLLDRRDPRPAARADALLATLSASERQRHAAYCRLADQQRFLVARAALRQLLGQWLEQPPAAVDIMAGPYGKPRCAGAPGFNLSHSGDLILLAFHGAVEVGVDVERARPELDWRPIAQRVFPPAQAAALTALPPQAQAGAFLRAWCRLEAQLKARGLGLAGLDQLRQAALSEGAVAALGSEEVIWDVAVPAGYAAAAALAPTQGPSGGGGRGCSSQSSAERG
ncbi:MAG: 4'-phosphopantetheinyl transferase superfamily protein [Cyanobacteriota bacterium]|nr:4'-phosphopantetheinyl transferase superfamily protein [Cyanobacteriota bacterium]